MKLPIDGMEFSESAYRKDGKLWDARTLYDFAKARDYPVVDMPLWCVNLGRMPFTCDSLKGFIFQCKRVNNCSLEHPIIVDDEGIIADGYHRVCKAILNGDETIKAIRMLEMPSPDEQTED